MVAHSHHLGNNGFTGPLDSKDFGELLQVVGCSFSDGEDGVAKPTHAQAAQLFIEELDAKLAGQQWDVLNNGQPHPPLLVLS